MFELSFDYFLWGFFGATAISLAAWRLKALSFSGAIGAIIIGTIVFGCDTISRGIPLIYFFISSSALSFIKSKRKDQAMQFADKTGPRDFWQVMANGGIAAIMAVSIHLFQKSYSLDTAIWLYITYIISLAIANADTWATEIGTLSREKPRRLFNFAVVQPGVSGGITLLGLLASFFGAVTVPIVSWYMVYLSSSFPLGSFFGGWHSIFLPVGSIGFCGGLIDSLLGTYLQGQYKCTICGKQTERRLHCEQQAVLIRDFEFINNDVINFLSQAIVILIILFWVYF